MTGQHDHNTIASLIRVISAPSGAGYGYAHAHRIAGRTLSSTIDLNARLP
ncbi:hypothetical protein ABLE94_02530 [Gordonia sp. VNK1]